MRVLVPTTVFTSAYNLLWISWILGYNVHVSRKLISWPCWISIVSQRISDCFLHKISCIDANLNEVKSQFETFFFLKQTKNNVSLFTLCKYSLGICSSTKALSVIYKKKKKRKENLWSQLKSHTVKISALQVILRFILKCNLHFSINV